MLTKEVLYDCRNLAVEALIQFAQSGYTSEPLQEIQDTFSVVHENVDEEASDSFFAQLLLPWYLYCWHTDLNDEGIPDTIASHFLKTKAHTVDGMTRRYLEAATKEPLSFWQIEVVEPGKGILVRDMFNGRDAFIRDMSMSDSAQKWDFLIGQIVNLDNESAFNVVGTYPLTSHRFRPIIESEKDRILKGPVSYPIPPEYLLDYDVDILLVYRRCLDATFNPETPSCTIQTARPWYLLGLVLTSRTATGSWTAFIP